MNIKMSKLITGDVILGDAEKVDGGFKYMKPVQLIMDPMQGGVGLVPFDAIFAQKEIDEIVIKDDHIMYDIEVSEPFSNSYIEFKTGIKVES